MNLEQLFQYDPLAQGAKGLVFIGQQILVYRRDHNTTVYPGHLDLPGGGLEPNETPFEGFRREVKEEFGLGVKPEDIVYYRRYTSSVSEGKFAYFPVAKLPESAATKIKFGQEGLEYSLMSLDEFIDHPEAWPRLRDFAADYAATLTK